jgi:L-arabinose isomerase
MCIGFPKPRPQLLERDERAADIAAFDKAESAKVKRRSRGRCEVTVGGSRCARRASEVHHHIGGWKRRGRGASAFAANKTHACGDCHRQITGNALEHLGGNSYRRKDAEPKDKAA